MIGIDQPVLAAHTIYPTTDLIIPVVDEPTAGMVLSSYVYHVLGGKISRIIKAILIGIGSLSEIGKSFPFR